MSQIYVKRNDDKRIVLIAVKVTDDILFAGKIPDLKHFAEEISARYKVRKIIIDDIINFNGCKISQGSIGNIIMDMTEFLLKLIPIKIEKQRRKSPDERATKKETESFRSLAGSLLWFGNAVMPQASCAASFMQQRITRMYVRDLIDSNSQLKQLRELKAQIRFKVPTLYTDLSVCSFSDAAFNITACQSYGQTGTITGLAFNVNRGRKPIFHLIDWTSCKQRRVSYSSYGAEILACAEADDRGHYVKQAVQSLFEDKTIKHELTVDSKGLYDTITTLHEGREYRLRQTVQRIRDSFESEELDALKWIQGFANIADALTKHNQNSYKLMSHVINTGTLDLPRHESYSLNSSEWK